MNHGNTALRRFGMPLCMLIVSLLFCVSIMAQQERPRRGSAPNDSMRMAFRAKTTALIAERCAGCHGGKHPAMGLDLSPDSIVEAVKDVPSRQIDSLMLVDTRMPERSYILMKLRGDKGIKGSRMPDGAPALSADEIAMIDRWIRGISGFHRHPRTRSSSPDSTRKR
jgi:mono/diheme cytochrome c family protein